MFRWMYHFCGRHRRLEHLLLQALYDIRKEQQIMANNFTALTAAIAELSTAVNDLVASADLQPQIDAATASVQAITVSITPAAPPNP